MTDTRADVIPTADATTDSPPSYTSYTFPFSVPADLSTADDDALRALLPQIREHAGTYTGLSPAEHTDESVAALQACRDLAVAVRGVLSARASRGDQVSSFADDIDAATADLPPAASPPAAPAADAGPGALVTGDVLPAADTVTAAVTAGAGTRPTVRQVAAGTRQPAVPPVEDTPAYASMTASADVPGFGSGQALDRFADAARAVSARLDQYPTMTAGKARAVPGRRPITVYDPTVKGRQLEMRHYTRHSAVQLQRHFPEDLRVHEASPMSGYAVAEFAATTRRLPGGSLLKSFQQQVAAGRALTAAAGWCAPSEMIYELCELETLDGLLDLPEIQTTRGGWQLPIDGGPDFGVIFGAIGNAGDTHLTEAEVIADTNKVCTDIPCPDFEDVRLGVDYVCLTGGLLQRRGYPEVVGRWSRGALIALAHKINQGLIAQIVAASGASTIIPADPSGDDAISGLLASVDLAIVDAKYRNRMGFNATLEVVLPMWVLAQIRAAATRRRGVDMVGVADSQLVQWFTDRNAVPRFVYDWQDSYSGLVGGPGAATPLTALPSTVDFLVYPAGTWVKAVQDVVNLDTIYDSTKLATNEYTAIFVEDGWAPLQMCPLSRRYTARVDPSGVVGCCPGAEVS